MLLSRGCQTCKSRRIKCDGTKPICHRCIKSKRICLDVNPPASQGGGGELSIRLENPYASGEKRRPPGPRSNISSMNYHLPLETRALCYFLKYQVQTATKTPHLSCGISESITAWEVSRRTCSMVDLAISTMALAVYSKTQHCMSAAREASARYHRLLGMAQARIANMAASATSSVLAQREIDVCLMAITMMGCYESSIYNSSSTTAAGSGEPSSSSSSASSKPMQTFCHHAGAMAVLKMWYDIRTPETQASDIINQTRRGLIRSFLMRGLRLPDWMFNGAEFGEHGLELEYDRIVVRIVNLRALTAEEECQRSRPALEDATQPQFQIRLLHLNTEAQALEKAFDALETLIQKTHPYQEHKLKGRGPWPKEHLYSSMVYIYSEPGDAEIWLQYFVTRMLLNSITLRIFDLENSRAINAQNGQMIQQQRQQLEYTADMNTMADRVASTIPYLLERVKMDVSVQASSSDYPKPVAPHHHPKNDVKPYTASSAIWPLTIAAGIDRLNTPSGEWFKSELENIGRIVGDGFLESVDVARQWVISYGR